MAGKRTDSQESHKVDIRIRLQPGSSKDEITGTQDDLLRVKVTAPPVEGKANNALIALLSKRLKIPKGDFELVSGRTARIKRIRIHAFSKEDIKNINLFLKKYDYT